MITLDDVRGWDAADPLAPFRDRFALPDGVIYLDGNSLGALPRATVARMRDVVDREWGKGLIRSWNDADWVGAPQRVGGKIARLIGAGADEVVVADSTSVCLFKLVMAAASLRDGAILAESDNFPTDAHVAARVAQLLGRGAERPPCRGADAGCGGRGRDACRLPHRAAARHARAQRARHAHRLGSEP
jgi:kynureninase